ncbi:MAG: hypothetical protein WAL22_12160 [Solirubrobacteraceae bacterium]
MPGTANPTVPATPLWSRYTASGHRVMALIPSGNSTLTPTTTIMAEHHCGFWDALNRSAPWAGHAG